ncbi:MAG: hypothetical protein II151_01950 [Bacteroidales bacterium]|nr:hypothetical protein [Bacteroidales bacterium]
MMPLKPFLLCLSAMACLGVLSCSDPGGKAGILDFATTERGDRIMDYSHAGYGGGGIALPEAPVAETVTPSEGITDYSPVIQAAIDRVSALPLKDGLRGAILLSPGDYPCSSEIRISEDGVVLRGRGARGTGMSRILMSGDKHTAVVIRRRVQNFPNPAKLNNPAVKVTDAYVPFGTSRITLAEKGRFKKGDVVWIQKKVTQKWIEFMHMDDMWRDGAHQTWIAVGTWLTTERTVESVSGNKVTFTVPLADSYDRDYTADSTFVSLAPPDDCWVVNSGVEHLRIVSPDQAESHTTAKYYALSIAGRDCWAQDMDLYETMESVRASGSRITLRKISVIREADHQGSSKPAEFAPNATQILMDSCYVKGNNIWFVGIGARIFGPIVMLNCSFDGNGRIQGHQRWSTAFLLDNCKVPDGGIDFINRGEMGSGHGWGTAWSVAWNCEAKELVNQLPPGTFNWMVGCTGKRVLQRRPFKKEGPMLEEGPFKDYGTHVSPKSLYLTQLEERCGSEALKAIGY